MTASLEPYEIKISRFFYISRRGLVVVLQSYLATVTFRSIEICTFIVDELAFCRQ